MRTREFAQHGGVTVKALLHYDRLGLLTPARTVAGHRVYSARDLERLRRILALKRAGVALTRMRPLLDADPGTLRAFLATSRQSLESERQRLSDAERALALVEESLSHAPDDRRGLGRLADVFAMREDVAQMRRYFSDDVWEQARRFYDAWPDESWIALYRDIVTSLADGDEVRLKPDTTDVPPLPGRPNPDRDDLRRRWNTLAQALWRDLATDLSSSRKLHEGFARAWRDRKHWPDSFQRRFADYRMDEVAAFLASNGGSRT